MASVPPPPDSNPGTGPDVQPPASPDPTPRPDEVSPPAPDIDQPDPGGIPGGDGGQPMGFAPASSRVGERAPDEKDSVGSTDGMEGVTGSQAGSSR